MHKENPIESGRQSRAEIKSLLEQARANFGQIIRLTFETQNAAQTANTTGIVENITPQEVMISGITMEDKTITISLGKIIRVELSGI